MQLITVFPTGQHFVGGDSSSWGWDAQCCFFSQPQFISFNATPAPPQPLKIIGASGSTGVPDNDLNRKAVGQVAGVVFAT